MRSSVRNGFARLLALLALVLVAGLGARCERPEVEGPLVGTSCSLGNSYAVDATRAIANLTGCPTIELAAPGRTIAGFGRTSMLQGPDDRLPLEDVLALASAEGPVTCYLQAGHGDELNPFWGQPGPEVIAARDAKLVEQLLEIRKDLVVVQLAGAPGSTCDHTYQRFLPAFGPRYAFLELERLDPIFEHAGVVMRDDCHPSELGAELRIAEAIRTSELAAAGLCWGAE